MNSSRTIVTGFFDLKRQSWPHFSRPVEEYMENIKNNLRINENMVIFIEPAFRKYIIECRAELLLRTKIITIDFNKLSKYNLREKIRSIQQSPKFRSGLVAPSVPEMWNPDYVVLSWSRIDMVAMAINENFFGSTHFAWMDLGMPDYCQSTHMPEKFNNKISLLCRRTPQPTDINRVTFAKSHINRFASGFITGNASHWLTFIFYMNKEINKCLNLEIVDCDQTLCTFVYIEHPKIFEIYHGDWVDIIKNYKITE